MRCVDVAGRNVQLCDLQTDVSQAVSAERRAELCEVKGQWWLAQPFSNWSTHTQNILSAARSQRPDVFKHVWVLRNPHANITHTYSLSLSLVVALCLSLCLSPSLSRSLSICLCGVYLFIHVAVSDTAIVAVIFSVSVCSVFSSCAALISIVNEHDLECVRSMFKMLLQK